MTMAPTDPGAFDATQYRAALLRKMRASEVVVHAARFAPRSVSGGPALVAATSSGKLHVFLLQPAMEPEYWERVERNEATPRPTPDLSFQAHPGQIYALEFAGDDAAPLLISGGDQDVRIWKWRDIAAALVDASRGPSVEIEPAHVTRLEREALGFRGALSPFSEINGVAVSREAARAFLAGGDGAAHELDLSSLAFVRRFTGHADYLHSVQYLSHSRELVTGSEDGTIGIWDARQARRVELLQPSTSPSSTSTNGGDAWVGSVAVDASETWLAAGGGGKKRARGGGFLGVWHLPSRVPVHVTPTPSDVYDVAFHRTELLSVGNDASLRQWNRSSGTLLATAHSSVPAGRFCVIDSASDVIAVGGAAPSIDIYAMPGVVSFSLVVQDDL